MQRRSRYREEPDADEGDQDQEDQDEVVTPGRHAPEG
jgi:hypothetical protein